MTPQQLTIDGGADAYPAARARRLTERQRELVRALRCGYVTDTRTAGRFYADPHGALRRLEALGLARHYRTGEWTARYDD